MKTASEILRERGRCTGKMFANFEFLSSGKVCTAGAVYLSTLPENADAYFAENHWPTAVVVEKLEKLKNHLGLHPTGDPLLAIGVWNDAPERTDAECIAALEACGL